MNAVGNYSCRCYEGYQLYGLTHCAGLYNKRGRHLEGGWEGLRTTRNF